MDNPEEIIDTYIETKGQLTTEQYVLFWDILTTRNDISTTCLCTFISTLLAIERGIVIPVNSEDILSFGTSIADPVYDFDDDFVNKLLNMIVILCLFCPIVTSDPLLLELLNLWEVLSEKRITFPQLNDSAYIIRLLINLSIFVPASIEIDYRIVVKNLLRGYIGHLSFIDSAEVVIPSANKASIVLHSILSHFFILYQMNTIIKPMTGPFFHLILQGSSPDHLPLEICELLKKATVRLHTRAYDEMTDKSTVAYAAIVILLTLLRQLLLLCPTTLTPHLHNLTLSVAPLTVFPLPVGPLAEEILELLWTHQHYCQAYSLWRSLQHLQIESDSSSFATFLPELPAVNNLGNFNHFVLPTYMLVDPNIKTNHQFFSLETDEKTYIMTRNVIIKILLFDLYNRKMIDETTFKAHYNLSKEFLDTLLNLYQNLSVSPEEFNDLLKEGVNKIDFSQFYGEYKRMYPTIFRLPHARITNIPIVPVSTNSMTVGSYCSMITSICTQVKRVIETCTNPDMTCSMGLVGNDSTYGAFVCALCHLTILEPEWLSSITLQIYYLPVTEDNHFLSLAANMTALDPIFGSCLFVPLISSLTSASSQYSDLKDISEEFNANSMTSLVPSSLMSLSVSNYLQLADNSKHFTCWICNVSTFDGSHFVLHFSLHLEIGGMTEAHKIAEEGDKKIEDVLKQPNFKPKSLNINVVYEENLFSGDHPISQDLEIYGLGLYNIPPVTSYTPCNLSRSPDTGEAELVLKTRNEVFSTAVRRIIVSSLEPFDIVLDGKRLIGLSSFHCEPYLFNGSPYYTNIASFCP
eukprot:TRINITY_DN3182_c0_g2_i1.p1 TRINITY_DN3182_c0_g2~~TRINITY_DN3182_c0_g2_i1.p1  ORF type:complete len:805 (-),score=164.95 TRINITY_DN3182_c0_g2_i1:276-2690(-)